MKQELHTKPMKTLPSKLNSHFPALSSEVFKIFMTKRKNSLGRMSPAPFPQRFRVMVAELGRFLGSEILLPGRVQVLLHLLHNVFGLVIVLDIQVCRATGNLLGVTTLGAELPLLEAVHVRERAARGTPDDEVHDKEVIHVIVINKYRRFAEKALILSFLDPR
jgi:hypothetical protein